MFTEVGSDNKPLFITSILLSQTTIFTFPDNPKTELLLRLISLCQSVLSLLVTKVLIKIAYKLNIYTRLFSFLFGFRIGLNSLYLAAVCCISSHSFHSLFIGIFIQLSASLGLHSQAYKVRGPGS